jgi:hypothetical protein
LDRIDGPEGLIQSPEVLGTQVFAGRVLQNKGRKAGLGAVWLAAPSGAHPAHQLFVDQKALLVVLGGQLFHIF